MAKEDRARHGSYLFQRPESSMWWIRLRTPGSKAKVHSLKTPDKPTAEVLAGPMITAHREALLAARPHFETAWRSERAPGLHVNPEGGHIAATERELQFFDANGAHVRTEPNGALGLWPVNHTVAVATLNNSRLGMLKLVLSGAEADRPCPAVKDADDTLLELYITEKNINPARAREARALFHLFKQTVGKPLAKCTRDDGRKVVAALGDVKSATLRRKMVPLVALANFGISESKLTFNPFSGVTPDRGDSERRLPFSDDDLVTIRANLDKLNVQDQLLVRTLATCGMRLSEAFEIDREQVENGVRFVVCGNKTDQSLRRVPLPAALLKHLPKVIKGKLFAGLPNAASTRLGKWLRDECKITDTAKVAAHSYRHRAKDKLRAAGCPLDVQYELLGHEEKTLASSYGIGSPLPVLKKWLDRVGF